MTRGVDFVADTHALVFFAADQQRRLGRKARAHFEAFEAGEAVLYVLAPVVIETWMLERGGRVKNFAALWERLHAPNIVLEPLVFGDISSARALAWDHRDYFDRMIVATTLRLGLPLVTADAAISDLGLVATRW